MISLMNIVKLSATLSLLVSGVAGTCFCGDVCKEYERKDGHCWQNFFDHIDIGSGCSKGMRLHYCEDYDYTCHREGLCAAGDWGRCRGYLSYDGVHAVWCPGTCVCNIFGCNCDPCEGCNHSAALAEGLADIPDSKDDHDWYMGLSSRGKLAHLNEVVCQKHGYGDATSLEFVTEIEDRTDKNHIDEHETENNGGKDDGTLSHEEFKAAYFAVDDLAKKYCAPIGGKSGNEGKSGKNSKHGKMAKRE